LQCMSQQLALKNLVCPASEGLLTEVVRRLRAALDCAGPVHVTRSGPAIMDRNERCCGPGQDRLFLPQPNVLTGGTLEQRHLYSA
jgi:hypothetical protein